MISEPLSDSVSPEPINPHRRDGLPLWVTIVLGLFLVYRLGEVGTSFFNHHVPRHTLAGVAAKTDLDDQAMQDLLETDSQSKIAFAMTAGSVGNSVRPDVKSLRQALTFAEALQQETGNATGAARRVILVRALLNRAAPGNAVIPPLAVGSHSLAPLDAFGPALPTEVSPVDRARLAAEGRLWQTVFEGGKLSPKQIADAAEQIRRIPNLRWWQGPALIALYTQQGDRAEADHIAKTVREGVFPSLLPLVLVGLFRFALTGLGVIVLIYLAARTAQNRHLPPGTPPTTDLWPTVPDALAPSQRKLGAGDLLSVFVLYLLSREVIGFLLTGFSGFAVRGLPHFAGLLAPFRPALHQMTASERVTVGIMLEAAVYLLSAVPPFILLWTMARSRGASLADEIGWTKRRLGLNLLYGAGGFAVASALILPVSLIARFLFRHAPDPSNPAITQIITASGFWGPFLLVVLASFCAPVVEEVLFRGVLYPAAKMRLGVWPAIVLSGLVFGLVHPVGIAGMLAIGTLGGVFAWMAETRKSLAPSMFAHFLQNFTTTMLLLAALSG